MTEPRKKWKPTVPTTGPAIAEYLVMPDFPDVWGWQRDLVPNGHGGYGTMFNFGGAVGCDRGWYGKHDLSRDLINDFCRWQRFWINHLPNRSYEPENYRKFPWRTFHQEGHGLCQRLKQEVGSAAKVFYIRPAEDPHNKDCQWLEFFADGSFDVPDDTE